MTTNNLPQGTVQNTISLLPGHPFQQGASLAAGEGFFVTPSDGEHHLRLTYSCATPGDIEASIRILAQCIQRARRDE